MMQHSPSKLSEFDIFLEGALEKCKIILSSKEKEYARNNNRLHNFHQAAKLIQCSNEEALLGMMVKHVVSVVDLLKDPENATEETVKEKLSDLRNYSILAEYMFYKRFQAKEINEAESGPNPEIPLEFYK